jgi:hypothetical protein
MQLLLTYKVTPPEKEGAPSQRVELLFYVPKTPLKSLDDKYISEMYYKYAAVVLSAIRNIKENDPDTADNVISYIWNEAKKEKDAVLLTVDLAFESSTSELTLIYREEDINPEKRKAFDNLTTLLSQSQPQPQPQSQAQPQTTEP